MENQTGNLGSPLSLSDPASSAQKALLSNTTTYLAKIAIVLHDAPDKMLTFTQVTKIQNYKAICTLHPFFLRYHVDCCCTRPVCADVSRKQKGGCLQPAVGNAIKKRVQWQETRPEICLLQNESRTGNRQRVAIKLHVNKTDERSWIGFFPSQSVRQERSFFFLNTS